MRRSRYIRLLVTSAFSCLSVFMVLLALSSKKDGGSMDSSLTMVQMVSWPATTATTFSFRRKRVGPKTDFTFHHGKGFCHRQGKNHSIIIAVHSSPSHFLNRQTIRQTWAAPDWTDDLGFKVYFLMGQTTITEDQHKIDAESVIHDDIVQYDMIDSYRNLTYKSLAGLDFLLKECNHTKYRWFVKTDDDMFIKPQALFEIAERNGNHSGRMIFCEHVFENALVHKKPGHKWFVRWGEWKHIRFPRHCPGSVNMFSRDLIAALLEKAKITRFLWIDDVYITGVLARAVGNVTHMTMPKMDFPFAYHTFQNMESLKVIYYSLKKNMHKQ